MVNVYCTCNLVVLKSSEIFVMTELMTVIKNFSPLLQAFFLTSHFKMATTNSSNELKNLKMFTRQDNFFAVSIIVWAKAIFLNVSFRILL